MRFFGRDTKKRGDQDQGPGPSPQYQVPSPPQRRPKFSTGGGMKSLGFGGGKLKTAGFGGLKGTGKSMDLKGSSKLRRMP